MKEERPRTVWGWVVLGVGVVIGIPGMWLGGHAVASRSLPEGPWDAGELPGVPEAEGNGLDDLMGMRTRRVPAVGEAGMLTVAIAAERGARGRWREVEERRSEVRALYEGAERASWMGRLDGILAHEVFVDACDAASECGSMEPLALVRFAAIVNLHEALQGWFREPMARVERLIVAAHGWLRTARTMDSHRVAALVAQVASEHARILIAGWRSSERSGDEVAAVEASIRAIDAELARMDRGEHTGRRAVIASCIFDREVLRQIVASPAGDDRIPGGAMAPYLVDARATLLEADEDCRKLLAWVDSADRRRVSPPSPRLRRSGSLWWLWNPGGKTLLDGFALDRGASLIALDDMVDEVFASREALRREIAAPR